MQNNQNEATDTMLNQLLQKFESGFKQLMDQNRNYKSAYRSRQQKIT